MNIDALRSVVAPPATPPEIGSDRDWLKVEKKLGITLPDDYKSFIHTYGSGNLADFIHVFNPFSESPHLSLVTNVEKICGIYRNLRASEGEKQVPFLIYPDEPGLIPWGRNDLGNYMFWLADGDPDSWPIILAEGRSGKYERFNVGQVEFLYNALQHKLNTKIWPSDFPEKGQPILFYPVKPKRTKPKKK